MKKITLILIGFLISLVHLSAAELVSNDTTIFYNSKTVHLQDSIGQMKVTVFDADSLPYQKVYEGIFSEGKSYEKWTVVEEVAFKVPNNCNNIRKRKYFFRCFSRQDMFLVSGISATCAVMTMW